VALVISIKFGQVLWVQLIVRSLPSISVAAYEIDIEASVNQFEPEIVAIGYMLPDAMGEGISQGQDLYGLSVCRLGNHQKGEEYHPQRRQV
jgi:hypothetical protein